MDPNLRIAQEFELSHRHSDASWSTLEAVEHGPPEHDAERSWLHRLVYRCKLCSEEVAITTRGADRLPVEPEDQG